MFRGFPKEGFDFLRQLKKHNKREWFQPRKAIFEEQVKAPMIELVSAFNARLIRLAPDFVTDPQKAIYRIYRDTRFSADKTPYKTHIAAIFRSRGMQKHASAGFYVGISPEEIEVAGGVYMPGPEELLVLRQHIAEHYSEFRKLAEKRSLTALMGALQGEALTRVPKGFPCDHPAADYLRMKQWYYYDTGMKLPLARSPKLVDELVKRARAMLPVIEFLNRPLRAAARKVTSFPAEGYL